jgi:anti-anti-sigma factor
MKVTKEKINNFSILKIEGRLDTITSPALLTEFENLFCDGEKDFIIDCKGLEFISSSGLRVFLNAHKKVSASDGKLVFCCMSPETREIFVISGFSKIFRFFETLGEGLEL